MNKTIEYAVHHLPEIKNELIDINNKYQTLLEFVKQCNEGVSIPLRIEVAIEHLFSISADANKLLKEIGEL